MQGQETPSRNVQPGQDYRPWEGRGFRMDAVPGAPPAAAEQPGQGDPTQNGGQQPPSSDGFRAFFPNLADEQWSQVEPHLRQVQAHVTRLEQVAKPFIDSGVTPDEASTLLQFAQAYSNDPVGTWLNQAQALINNGQLDGDELNFEELVAIATGQPSQESQGPPGPEGEPGGPSSPEVARLEAQVEELTGLVGSLTQDRQQEKTQAQARQQNQLLDKTVTTVKDQLKQAGVPAPDDNLIIASIIASKGNPSAVVQSLTGYKGEVLRGITEPRQETGQPPRMPRGAPTPPPRQRGTPGGRRDPYAGAREGAKQFLSQQNEAAAQEA
jgi:hypothetical protein